tara:strand:+ start:521 stop:1597 length:1077 start_codon:yes stop_codon:yes gene_type:complete
MGDCNYCKYHQRMSENFPQGRKGRHEIKKLVHSIKNKQSGKYDSIIGVSGGVDSTYTLYMAKKLGLSPLAVHVDNGWNSELAVKNIELVTKKLNVDLETIILDWNMFRDIQYSFLQASVPDGEIPSDIALQASLFDIANKYNVKYIIYGYNFREQGISPISWTYMDGKYIKSVHETFSSKKLTGYPNLSISKLIYSTVLRGVRTVSFLEYIDYDISRVKNLLMKKLKWRPYEGKHYESNYTKFFQGYILPTKFNIDKRKIYLSTQIREKKISKDDAIKKIKKTPPMSVENFDIDKKYILKKLRITDEEFLRIMNLPPKSFKSYSTYLDVIKLFRYPIKFSCDIGILPKKFYEKYLNLK